MNGNLDVKERIREEKEKKRERELDQGSLAQNENRKE